MKTSFQIALGLSLVAVVGIAVILYQSDPKPLDQTVADHSEKIVDLPLSPRVAAMLSDEYMESAHRKAILNTLGDSLSPQDIEAMLEVTLGEPLNGITASRWPSFVNDIFKILRFQKPFVETYTDHLVKMWLDKQMDPTLRDYAIQHLREWVSDTDNRTEHETRPEKLAWIRQTFIDACTEGHTYCDLQSTTTGTTLMALEEWADSVAPKQVRVEPEKLNMMLLAFASNKSAHRGVRATALQLCAKRNMLELLPLARELVPSSSTELILRLSAISYLGKLGSSDDHKMLESLLNQTGADPLTRGALTSALSTHTSSQK